MLFALRRSLLLFPFFSLSLSPLSVPPRKMHVCRIALGTMLQYTCASEQEQGEAASRRLNPRGVTSVRAALPSLS